MQRYFDSGLCSTRIIRRQVAILLTEDWRCDAVKEQPTDVYDVLLMLVTSDDPVVAVWGAIALGQGKYNYFVGDLVAMSLVC